MDIHGDSTFSNVGTFEEEEEDNDVENEVEDGALRSESILAQSTKKESAKAECSHGPPKGSLLHHCLDVIKKLVLSPKSEHAAQEKNRSRQALIH